MIATQLLDTKISYKVIDNKNVSHYFQLWTCGKMSQENINNLENYTALRDRVMNKVDGGIKCDVEEVIFQKKPIITEYGEIYKGRALGSLKVEKELNTKVSMRITLNNYGNDTLVSMTHMWLPGKFSKSEVIVQLNSMYFKNKLKNYLGTEDSEIVEVLYTIDKPIKTDFYDIIIDSKMTIKQTMSLLPKIIDKTSEVFSWDIDKKPKAEKFILSDMDNVELLNLKDRIEEILFKREHNFSDDEYEFYLENETLFKPTEIKEIYAEYLNDKFKIRKMKIRKKLGL